MSLDNTELSERELDRFCWLLIDWRNGFCPPDETAQNCIDSIREDDNVVADDKAVGHEEGYHTGMFTAFNEMIEQLYGYGINVMGRANRFTKVNRDADWEFRLDDEPDFYRAVKHGSEVKAVTSSIYDGVEIESLNWDEPGYTVEPKS